MTAPLGPPDGLTAETYIELQRPSAVRVAPDGKTVALAVRGADLASNRFFSRLHLWRETGDGGASPRFEALRMPRWSRDGSRIGFLAGARHDAFEGKGDPGSAKRLQLWSIDATTPASPRRHTDFGGGVLDYDWTPEGDLLALAREGPGATPVLWRLAVGADSAERVWSGEAGIRQMALSPEGGMLVYSVSAGDADEERLDYDLRILELETGRSRRLTGRSGPEVDPAWTPEGDAVIFRAPTDPAVPTGQAALFRIALDGALQNLTDAFDRSVLAHRAAGDRIVFSAAVGTRTHLFVLRPDGAVQRFAGGQASYAAFDAAGAGITFAVRQSASEPPELWRLGGAGPERVTRLNEAARDWPVARQKVIRWRAPDGLSVEGLLVYPADYEEGRRYPLLVHPAGGPGGRAIDVFAQSAAYRLFAAAGYAVLVPNFRGGPGYGRDFAAEPQRALAGGHLADVVAGIRHLAELGVADMAHVGIYGSGYVTRFIEWALTRSTLFDAGALQFGIDGLVWPDESTAGQATGREEARREARAIQTPLLIVAARGEGGIGEEGPDPRSLFSELEALRKEAELVEVPDRKARSPQGRVDLFLRHLRWMDRHLKTDGAELFSFYMVDETVPGSEGWTLRVGEIETVAAYAAVQPDSGRFVEITFEFQPDPEGPPGRRAPGFELDPGSGVRLIGPGGEARPLAGTVTELFGEKTLILGMPTAFSIPPSRQGAPTALTLELAFQVPDASGAYRLQVDGFRPVRIWLPGAEETTGTSR